MSVFCILNTHFLHLFVVCLCIPTYHMHNNYTTYVGAMQLHFSRLWTAALSIGEPIYTMSSYKFEKQKQCRRIDTRLTDSGNARSEQHLLSR